MCVYISSKNPQPSPVLIPIFILLKLTHPDLAGCYLLISGADCSGARLGQVPQVWAAVLSLTCQTCSTVLPRTGLSTATPSMWTLDANYCPTSLILPSCPAHLLILSCWKRESTAQSPSRDELHLAKHEEVWICFGVQQARQAYYMDSFALCNRIDKR